MTERTDITRWNRAGMRRFRYVDGNAATFLEELRCRLNVAFPGWKKMADDAQRGQPEVERLRELYEAPRGQTPDWGWELARSLSRAVHVLAEHLDAYANEGYLPTATQWESLRRLVEMIDYHPAPPASAITPLALEARAAGTVARGLAARHSPPSSEPVVFETIEDLAVDPALNELRPCDHDRSPDALSGHWLELEGAIEGLTIGDPLIVEDERSGVIAAHLIEAVKRDVARERTRVRIAPRLSDGTFVKGWTRVHAVPKDRLQAVGPTRGSGVVGKEIRFAAPARSLSRGDVITVSDGVNPRRYRRVKNVRGRIVEIDRAVGPVSLSTARVGTAVELSIARHLGRRHPSGAVLVFVLVPGDWKRLVGDVVADLRVQDANAVVEYEATVFAAPEIPAVVPDEEMRGHTVLKLSQKVANGEPAPFENAQALLVPPPSSPLELDVPLVAADNSAWLPAKMCCTKPKALSPGDLVAVVAGGRVSWGRLADLEIDPNSGEATLTPSGSWQGRGGSEYWLSETRVFGHFREVARITGWDRNLTPITDDRVPLPAVPGLLRAGRKVLVYRDGPESASSAILTAIDHTESGAIVLAAAVPEGSTAADLVILGNVALASHGEQAPEKILGSGAGTSSGQTFVLAEPNLTFVPDPAFASGVRADIVVAVDERMWEQVPNFRRSGPTDPHYVVRMLEDGTVAVVFGDGRAGRRLPTGTNNVRVAFRRGSGGDGNVDAGSLELARPNTMVDRVRQPLDASGGNEMEGVASLRQRAPATVLTLERAVSLADFARLAMAHSSVWCARSLHAPSAQSRRQRVEVVVVPAGGRPLGPLRSGLEEHLRVHAVPGVDVVVSEFVRTPIRLAVTIEVDLTAYDPSEVMGRVRTAVLAAFSLERRELGQPLALSDVYRVVENVVGVESSVCIIDDDPRLQLKAAPSERHVLFLDPAAPQLDLHVRGYSL